ncbi:HET-domain-containing protein [Westerdykella ornata]|uniref:HET-domain-containing protein n=1 Tax=Westerdykella ornata TaxID=318751 RepID=A0A6A6JNU8_WESOR|nr:HET-domain-containing protein [Westerdykella ornata]KAF2277823.1 HET-domain-containing protein [Westerdykella ornata]
MTLCAACRSITVSALSSELEHVPLWWWELNSRAKPRGMVHHVDARQLPLSATAGCPLCRLIVAAILQDAEQRFSDQDPQIHREASSALASRLSSSPIYLRPNTDPLKQSFPQDDVPGAPYVRGFKVFVPTVRNVLVGQIRLFTLKDSPAARSCDIVGRPPLPASDSPAAFELIHQWLTRCLRDHDACKESFSGADIDESKPSVLPTRVVHVGNPDQGLPPRLCLTGGKRDHYVAFSHCWGRNKPPLMTTASTLQERMAGIPWNEIPKLYQDAIVATHRLGFKYIWIDSLCIIQDSKEDWLNESRHMGTVYENARLTIAASHAADSSESCFPTRPRNPDAVELPYFTQSGDHAGSMFATWMPADYASITPDGSVLDSRAWATQEWLLSRRMIFFTAASVVWSCKSLCQLETGGCFHSTARNARWKAIVEKYSARALTLASDRLIALEGLRTEMGKKRKGDTYCFGLWKHQMPEQLLWYCRQPAERRKSPLDLPTWTWASTMHGVRFIVMKHPKNACGGIKFDEPNKTLIVRGVLRRTTLTPCDPNSFQHSDGSLPFFPKLAEMLEHEIPSHMLFTLCIDNEIIGKAVIDEGLPLDDTDIYALYLVSAKIHIRHLTGGKTTFHQQWVLLLRRLDQFAEVYERIGAGLLVSATPLFTDQSPTQVYIR